MRVRKLVEITGVVAIVAAGMAGWARFGSSDDTKPAAEQQSTSTEAQPAAIEAKPAAGSGAVTVTKPGTAKWSATTQEAAASQANKKVLATGKAATVRGEVVDVSCYLQLGKRGEAHVACGSKCIEHGEPIGIVDAKGTLYILFAEEHHPRRDGEVDLKKAFLPLLAKNVEVTGMVTDMKGVKALFVPTSELSTELRYEKLPEK